MLLLVLLPSGCSVNPFRYTSTADHLAVATRDVVTPMATLSPTMRRLKPCLPTLSRPCRWIEARGTLCSPSLDLHRLSKLIVRGKEVAPVFLPSKEDGEAIQWREEDLFIDNENIADDAESTTSASTSPPPSPLFDLAPSTSIRSNAIYSTAHPPVFAADLPVARVLFSGIAEDPPATNTNEDDLFRYSVTRSALREEHVSYSELYPGEEVDDDAYFAEPPVFADSPPPSIAYLREPIFLVTHKKSTSGPDSHPHAPRDFTSALNNALPPATPSFAPALLQPTIPTSFSIEEYELVETILETIDEEDEGWESSSSASESDEEFNPWSTFPSPIVKPPSHLVPVPSDHVQHSPRAAKWVHLPSLRAPLSRREMRGCSDWRDGLRREAIGRSASLQQLPWWR